jgi:MOSC domain-containing protein YiiM
MAHILAVNIGVAEPTEHSDPGVTGIRKRPVGGPVMVCSPAAGSGLAGDAVCDRRVHGGFDQAVYAYASEDLADWSARLGRTLEPGLFGENLTTWGVDVSGALIGEVWQVGAVTLEVSTPRIPCRTFAAAMGEPDWVRRFTKVGAPGAYLRVLVSGEVRAGDEVRVVSRPEHTVTIGLTFRALTGQAELLPALLAAPGHPERIRQKVLRRLAEPEAMPAV